MITAPQVIEAAAGPLADAEISDDERRGGELVATFLKSSCDERDRTLYVLRYERELSQVDAAVTANLTRIQIRRWETKFRARLVRYLKRADYERGGS